MVEKADRYPCTVQNPLKSTIFSPFLATQIMMLNKRRIDAKGNKRRKKT